MADRRTPLTALTTLTRRPRADVRPSGAAPDAAP